MKNVLLALASGAFLFSCNSNKEEGTASKNSDWTAQHLKGKVQTMEETTYTPDSTGKIGAMDSCCVNLQEFDEKGYNNKTTSKDSKGTVKEMTTITRYDGGQVKEVVTMKDGRKESSFSVQISKEGKYIGGQAFDSTGKMTSFYTDLKEDEYGSVTGGTEHKPDSSVKSSFMSESNKGMTVNSTGKDSSGKVTFTYKAELNDKGDVAKSTTMEVGKDSTTTKVNTFTYDSFDEQGNWTQRTTYNEKGKATKVLKRAFTYYKKE
jgi:hypothetical protein